MCSFAATVPQFVICVSVLSLSVRNFPISSFRIGGIQSLTGAPVLLLLDLLFLKLFSGGVTVGAFCFDSGFVTAHELITCLARRVVSKVVAF